MTKNGINDVTGRVRMRHCAEDGRRNDRSSKVTSMIELFSSESQNEEFLKGSPKPNVSRIATFLDNHRDAVQRERKPGAISTTENQTPQPLKRRTSPISISNRAPKPYSRPTVPKRPVSLAAVDEFEKVGVASRHTQKEPGYSSKPTSANAKEAKRDVKAESVQSNTVQRRFQTFAKPEKTLPKKTTKPGVMASERLKNGSLPTKYDSSSSNSISSDVTDVEEMSSANRKIRNARDYWEHKLEPKAGMEKSWQNKSETNSSTKTSRPNSVSSESVFTSASKSNGTARGSPKLRLKSADYNSGGSAQSATAYRENKPSSVADLVRNFSIKADDRTNSTVNSGSKPSALARPRFLTTSPAYNADQSHDMQSSIRRFGRPSISPTTVRKPLSPLASPRKHNPTPVPRSSLHPVTMTTNTDGQKRNDGNNNRVVNPLPKPARTFTIAASDLTGPIKQRSRRVARDSSNSSHDYDKLATSSSHDSPSPSPNYFSRIPKDGYEQVSFFDYSGKRAFFSQNRGIVPLTRYE